MEKLSTIGRAMPTSSDNRTFRNSQALIRSQSSRSDAGDIVGRILNRFRLAQGWNAEEPENHKLRVAAWLEVLGVNRIPVGDYEDLFRRALETRARKQAAGKEVFYIRPDDLVIEFRGLEKPEPPPIDAAHCPEIHNHRSDEEAQQDYGFPGEAEEWLPCHVCRPRAFRQRKAERSTERAEKTRQTVRGMLAAARPLPQSSELDRQIDAICEKMRRDPADPELQQQYRDAIERKAREFTEENDEKH